MKKIVLFFCFTILASSAFAQIYLEDNFNYPAGDSLGAHGWLNASPTGAFGTNTRLVVASTGLSYAGYPLSGIGNSANVTSSGQDSYENFTSVIDSANGKSVYASFMIRIDSAKRPGDYFLAFLPSNSVTNYDGRVFVRSLDLDQTLDSLNFGITKGSPADTNTAGMWTTGFYSANTTYLVVVKYTFITGSSNDQVSLFVFPSGIPATEPTPTIGPITFPSNTDAFTIGRIALRQGTANRAPYCLVDGIRVSTSWFSTEWDVKLAVQGLYDQDNNNLSIADTVNIYLHKAISPYVIVDSAKAIIDVSTFIGSFVFHNASSGTYYLDVRYRNLPYRNGIQTWSKSGGEPFTALVSGSYDFTNSPSQAFGNNLFLKGSVYTIYNGDVNQDGFVDLTDLNLVFNAASVFAVGYLNTDLNGDELIDLTDVVQAFNNSSSFVSAMIPAP